MFIRTKFPYDFSRYQCELGEKFTYTSPRTKKISTVKFIKVTRKGFNFLNLGTNKCIFATPVYDSDLSNKKTIDPNLNYFRVQIPNWFKNGIKRQTPNKLNYE